MTTTDPNTQKSVLDSIRSAQCALHEADCFYEIITMIDSDIELPDHLHDFLYGSIRKSHSEVFDALEHLERECLQEPCMTFVSTIGGEQ